MALSRRSRTAVVAALGVFACACGDGRLRSICVSGAECQDPGQPVPPTNDADAGDAEPDGGAPESKCNGGLCTLPPPPHVVCGSGMEWDDSLGACIAPVDIVACTRPQTGFFAPEVLWEFAPKDWNQVITTPVVIDVNGDGASDVIAPFFDKFGAPDSPAMLRALSGVDGQVLWETPASDDGLAGSSTLAAAVLAPGEPPTIVGQDLNGLLSAYDGSTGELLWRSHDSFGAGATCDSASGTPAIADLDADGHPEIVCGFTVFDASGQVRWSHADAFGPFGALVALADLNGDGKLDLTDGTHAYRHDGQLLWDVGTVFGGLASVADVMKSDGTAGRDGKPEVVVARNGQLEVRDGASGQLDFEPVQLPTWDGQACYTHQSPPGIGGAPAIGDTNGDGLPEIALTSGECLTLYSILPADSGVEFFKVWSEHAVDASSKATGVALFDFDADGDFDVVHADETQLHIIEGTVGTSIYKAPHCSATIYEEPVVADVDGDGSANVVLVRNKVAGADVGCASYVQPGVQVLREAKSRWANARGLWNQHAYVATQICDGRDWVCDALDQDHGGYGMVPGGLLPPWQLAEPGARFPFDAVRANTRGPWEKTWGADAAITHVVIDKKQCPAMTARVRVVNHGQVPLRPGTLVRVSSEDGSESSVGTTTLPIQPGGAEIVDVPLPWASTSAIVTAVVDGDDRTAECREENNQRGPVKLRCPQ